MVTDHLPGLSQSLCNPVLGDAKAIHAEYLEFLEAFFALLKQNAKKTTRLAFINADWRDFQNKPAAEESGKGAILIDDYLRILNKTGWQHTHIIQAPMSAQRFSAVVVSAMQKKRILGVTSRYVIILKQ